MLQGLTNIPQVTKWLQTESECAVHGGTRIRTVILTKRFDHSCTSCVIHLYATQVLTHSVRTLCVCRTIAPPVCTDPNNKTKKARSNIPPPSLVTLQGAPPLCIIYELCWYCTDLSGNEPCR